MKPGTKALALLSLIPYYCALGLASALWSDGSDAVVVASALAAFMPLLVMLAVLMTQEEQ